MHPFLITPITEHRAFIRARSLRYRHYQGMIIHTCTWGDECLTRSDVLLRIQEIDRDRTKTGMAAIVAGEDRRLLTAAYCQYLTFWETADSVGSVAR